METNILFSGLDITKSQTDVLQPVEIQEVVNRIQRDELLRSEIERIRKIRSLDSTAYENVKKRLPYICCSRFANNMRKSEHFMGISHFILDLDKIPGAEKLEEVRKRIQADQRVKVLFVSPGGYGLKVMMELSAPCISMKQYSDFYKAFSYDFARFHKVESFVDYSTCDATRVCFLSHDPLVYFNPGCEKVNVQEFLPVELDFSVSYHKADPETVQAGPSQEVYQSIMARFGGNARPVQKEKQIFVPEILNTIVEPLTRLTSEMGIEVREVRDINYGKKVVFALGYSLAELNIFYGSRGFSVVKSPKNGSDPRLADAAEMLVRGFLSGRDQRSVQAGLATREPIAN